MKPQLFLLKMPFQQESNKSWFCTHCAMLEGALMVNPHWENHITIRRIAYPKPREELVKLLGPKSQWLPVLIIDQDTTLTHPVDIAKCLARKYGGAEPHP